VPLYRRSFKTIAWADVNVVADTPEEAHIRFRKGEGDIVSVVFDDSAVYHIDSVEWREPDWEVVPTVDIDGSVNGTNGH